MAFPDLVHHARQRGWKAEDPLELAFIAQKVSAGAPVTIVQLAGVRDWPAELPRHITLLDDLPADPSTTGVLPLGGQASGVFETDSDVDWFAITLTAGQSLQVSGPEWLSHIRFYDAFGNPVEWTSSASSTAARSRPVSPRRRAARTLSPCQGPPAPTR